MSLTPVEIRHVKLGRRPFGYDRRVTDELLSDIVNSFEGKSYSIRETLSQPYDCGSFMGKPCKR